MDTSRLRHWGSLRADAAAHATPPPASRSPISTTHLRHGRPHRIRGWALVRWAGARLAQRRYLRLVHYALTVFDGADEHVDLVLLEQVLVGTKVHWNARKHEIVIRTQDKDKIVVTVRTAKEFDAWKVGFADAAREPAQYYTLVQSRKLGAGAFSEVFFGFDRDNGDHAAIKVVDKTQCTRGELEHAQTEARVMAFVRHPAVITCRDIFDGPDSLHVVMEFMPGGTLEERVRHIISTAGRLPEHVAATVLESVLSALVYLEAEGICHRDIKPDNILIGAPPLTSTAPGNEDWAAAVRLSDFGLAAFVDSRGGTLLTDFVGTPHYVAPEVLARSADNSRIGYGCTVDVWAVGVIAYWMLSGGELPFDGTDSSAVCRAIRDGGLAFTSPNWEHVSEHGKSFVRSLLQPSPRVRLTAAAALTHPWMLRSRGQRTAAVAAATATAFAISRAAGPVRTSPGDVFLRRRLVPRALFRVAAHAVCAASRLCRAVLSAPLVPERDPGLSLPAAASGPNAQSSPELGSRPRRQHGEIASFASLKRPLSKKQAADRMLPAPERAPIGTDGLGYNVGLFRSFAPKQRQRAGTPDPTAPKGEYGGAAGAASTGSLSLTYGRRSAGAGAAAVPASAPASAPAPPSPAPPPSASVEPLLPRSVTLPPDSDSDGARSGATPSTSPLPGAGTGGHHRLRPLTQRAKSLNSRASHRRRARDEGNAAAAAR